MTTQLEEIIKEGTLLNEAQDYPTKTQKLNLKIDCLNILSDHKDTFVMNRKFFDWNKKLVDSKATVENYAEWLLDPLLVFCNQPEDIARLLADELHKKKYKYVRARNDNISSRLIVDVEFEVVAIINPNNKTIQKHSKNLELFGSNININGLLLLPIFLYDYITPKFNWEQWKDNLLIEPFLWTSMVKTWEKSVLPIPPQNLPKNMEKISEKIFEAIKTEDEADYVFTGFYTYSLMTSPNIPYTGEYHIYHQNPMVFLKKINDRFLDIEVKMKEDSQIYYFQGKQYLIYFNGQLLLTIYELNYPINYIKLGVYNHTNYHGVLLFLLIDAFKSPLKDYDEKCAFIGYLVKTRNIFLKSIEKEPNVKNIFEVLQNNQIGPNTTPYLNFKIKEFHKELTFYHKPEKTGI
jgi:hypothetical protein